MLRFIPFVAGFIVCATLFSFTFVMFAQGENPLAYLKPLVVDINQSVPVTATVGLMIDAKQVTATVPLTIDIALQVHISGIHSVTMSSAIQPIAKVEQPTAGAMIVDDLGHAYQILTDSDDIEITEWTAFVNSFDRFEFSAVIQQHADTKPIDKILATLRMYNSKNNILAIVDVMNVSFQLKPGGESRFGQTVPTVLLDDLDHYTLELKIIR